MKKKDKIVRIVLEDDKVQQLDDNLRFDDIHLLLHSQGGQ